MQAFAWRMHRQANVFPCVLYDLTYSYLADVKRHGSIVTRLERGSDDPDDVGHLGDFFDGSSGSHPQIKLSGCDRQIF